MEIKTLEQFNDLKRIAIRAVQAYGKTSADIMAFWYGIDYDVCKKFELLATHLLDSRSAESVERRGLCFRCYLKLQKAMKQELGIYDPWDERSGWPL